MHAIMSAFVSLHVVKQMSKSVLSRVVETVFNIFAFGKVDFINATKFLFRSRDTSKLKSPTIINLLDN